MVLHMASPEFSIHMLKVQERKVFHFGDRKEI